MSPDRYASWRSNFGVFRNGKESSSSRKMPDGVVLLTGPVRAFSAALAAPV